MIAEAIHIVGGLAAAGFAVLSANAHRPGRTAAIDMIGTALIGTAGVFAIIGVPLSRGPVVVQSQAEIISHEPGLIRLHLTGFKPLAKAGCTYIPPTEAFVVSAHGALEVAMQEEGDPYPGSTRPPGQIDFGTWAVTYPQGLAITQVKFRASHQCAWWMPKTKTDQGPFTVPRLPE